MRAEDRAIVSEIVDEIGYVEVDAEADGREGELLGGDFEGDEKCDEEVTRDFYGEDDE